MKRSVFVLRSAILAAGFALASAPVQAAVGVTDWLVVGTATGDFTTLHAAVDVLNAVPGGGTIYVKANSVPYDETIATTITQPMRIIGCGSSSATIRWTLSGTASLIIRSSDVSIENLKFDGGGLKFDPIGANTGPLHNLALTNVDVVNTQAWALEITGDGANVANQSRVDGCHFSNNASSGQGLLYVGLGTNALLVKDCTFANNYGTMMQLVGCGPLDVVGCTFNVTSQSSGYNAVTAVGINAVTIRECSFTATPATQTAYFVYLSGLGNRNLTVADCSFSRPDQSGGRILQCPSGSNRIQSLVVINPRIDLGATVTPTGPDLAVLDPGSRVSVVGGITTTTTNYYLPRINDGTNSSFLAGYNERLRVPRADSECNLKDLKIGDVIYNVQTGNLEVYRSGGWSVITTTPSP